MNLPSPSSDSRRGRDERMTLFPSLAYYDVRRGGWRAIVQGRAYDVSRIPISTRILLKGLKRALKATEDELASEIFRERIQGFTAKPIRGRRIRIDLAGHVVTLRRKSKRNGAFLGVVKLPEDLVVTGGLKPEASKPDAPGSSTGTSSTSASSNGGSGKIVESIERNINPALPIRLLDLPESMRGRTPSATVESQIYVIKPQGLSIVSDIDDTIKATDVSSRRTMLANTFLKPFAAVDGMAELYRRWHEAGADFHYVSSSPWELFQPLAELCQLSRFPPGSMHLRYFRVRDEMFKRWRPQRRKGKAAIIAGLMKKMPGRRFVLVGDSGERDSEIYRFLARRFPKQVPAIVIRQLDAKPLNDKRLARLRDVPAGIHVELFQSPKELDAISDRIQNWISLASGR